MSVASKELSFGVTEFFSSEHENHQFRKLTRAVKALNQRLVELEKTSKSIVGRLEKQMSANMYFHCKLTTFKLTKEYRKLAYKFLENVVLAQKDKTGSSFVSTDHIKEEETMRTRETEQSFNNQQQEFEKLEVDRLTKSVAEIHLLLEQQLRPTAYMQGSVTDRIDSLFYHKERAAAVLARVEGEAVQPRESFCADNCIRVLSIAIICLVMLLLWKSTLSDD